LNENHKERAKIYLRNYKQKVDRSLTKYFEKKKKQADKIDPLSLAAVRSIEEFTLSGGKRIRPAVVYYAYLALGGENEKAIIEASMSVELVHSFLLIHDDVIDRDKSRHGVDTVHESYRKKARFAVSKEDLCHFGNSMAIVVGDVAYSMANEIMFNSAFPAETIIKALNKIQQIVYRTIPGEMLDVVMQMRGKTTENEIMRMYEGKTARYTFEGPIHLGMVLAQSEDQKILQAFSQYSLDLGIAFQIRDDILGIFADEQKLGKDVGSDIIEGKQTLLVFKTLKAGGSSALVVKKLLGKKNIKKKEIEEFRRAVTDSGALAYCNQLIADLTDRAVAQLEKIDFKNKEAKDFFISLAEYVGRRDY